MKKEGLIYTTVILGALSLTAFTKPVRNQVLERDGHQCRLCGSKEHLEAAHINHNKNNPRYNDASNGMTLDVGCHLKDHLNRHGRNGLNNQQNNWAIQRLREKLQKIISGEE